MRVDDPSVGYCLGTGGDAAAETAVADRGSAVASSSTFIAAGRPAVVAAIVLVAAVGLMACRPGGDGGGDAGGSADTGAAARQAPADCDPARPAAATDDPQTFRFDGEQRAYLLALPDDYDGATAHPLVFSFHGFASNKEGQEAYTAMADQGTARGYVVVTPDALGDPRDWNYFGDRTRAHDFGFVEALVADLSERLCIDADRV